MYENRSNWAWSQVKGGVARKRQNGSPSFTRHLTPFILSILHREEEQNGKVEELKNSIVEIRVISLYVNAQCSLLFFYPRSTYKFSRTHLKVFERSRSSWNLKVLVVDERGKPCGVSEGKTTRKTRCTYVCTDCIASAPGGNRTQATVGTGECFHYGVNLLRRHKYGGWKSVLNGQINQRTDISKDDLDLNKQHRREARFWFGSGLETASIAIHHNPSPTPTALQIALAFSKT